MRSAQAAWGTAFQQYPSTTVPIITIAIAITIIVVIIPVTIAFVVVGLDAIVVVIVFDRRFELRERVWLPSK